MKNKKGFSTVEFLLLIVMAVSLGIVLVPRLLQEDLVTRVNNIEQLAFKTASAINHTHASWEASGHNSRLDINGKVVLMSRDGWPETLDDYFAISGKMTPAKCINVIQGLTDLSFNMAEEKDCKDYSCEFKVVVDKDETTCKFIEYSKQGTYNTISYNLASGEVLVSSGVK